MVAEAVEDSCLPRPQQFDGGRQREREGERKRERGGEGETERHSARAWGGERGTRNLMRK